MRQRHPRRLADKRHRTRCARVNFQHVDNVVLIAILDVHQSAHAKRKPNLFRVVADDLQMILADLVGRQHRRRVAAMNACLFDMLEDAADDDVLAIADGIDIQFKGVLQEAVDQHRLFVARFKARSVSDSSCASS